MTIKAIIRGKFANALISPASSAIWEKALPKKHDWRTSARRQSDPLYKKAASHRPKELPWSPGGSAFTTVAAQAAVHGSSFCGILSPRLVTGHSLSDAEVSNHE
jgi:hypothetical protein